MIAYINKSLDIMKEIDFNTFKALHKELVYLESSTASNITDLYIQVKDIIYYASISISDNNMYINSLEVSELCLS